MRIRIISALVFSFCLLLHGSMSSIEFHQIDFTKISKDDPQVTFAPADKLSLTKEGLGWDGEANSSFDGSFTTAPIAVGTAWRPLTGISLAGTISPAPRSFKNASGQTGRPWRGELFARYSPDKKNWSTWQSLPTVAEPKDGDKGTQFRGSLDVPRIQRREYSTLYDEYGKLDVPWASDEEAMVKWILQKRPEFFAKNLPFIGYIQFHFEAPFMGGQRLQSFDYRISWGMSGLGTSPKDPNTYKNSAGPWRFDATKEK